MGMWLSGRAFALHVKGPGFDPRHLQKCFFLCLFSSICCLSSSPGSIPGISRNVSFYAYFQAYVVSHHPRVRSPASPEVFFLLIFQAYVVFRHSAVSKLFNQLFLGNHDAVNQLQCIPSYFVRVSKTSYGVSTAVPHKVGNKSILYGKHGGHAVILLVFLNRCFESPNHFLPIF